MALPSFALLVQTLGSRYLGKMSAVTGICLCPTCLQRAIFKSVRACGSWSGDIISWWAMLLLGVFYQAQTCKSQITQHLLIRRAVAPFPWTRGKWNELWPCCVALLAETSAPYACFTCTPAPFHSAASLACHACLWSLRNTIDYRAPEHPIDDLL